MTIQFFCSQCGREFNVPDQMAGTAARCNTCGNIVTVPPGEELVWDAGLANPALAGYRGKPKSYEPGYAMGAPSTAEPLTGQGVAAGSDDGLPKAAWIAIGVGGAATALVIVILIVSSLLGGSSDRPVAASPVPGAATTGQATPGSSPLPNSSSFTPAREPRPLPSTSTPSARERSLPQGTRGDLTAAEPTARTAPVSSTHTPHDISPAAAVGGASTLPSVPNLADVARSRTRQSGVGTSSPGGRDDPGESQRRDFVPWEAVVDGPAQAIDYRKGKMAIPVPSGGSVLFPPRPSNYVLVTGRDSQRRTIAQVFDLRTGKEIGAQATFEDMENPKLFSPDGRYAAVPLRLAAGARLGIWSFVTGEMVQMLELGGFSSDYQDFAAPHQYIAIENGSREWVVRGWDVTTGQQNAEFVVGDDPQRRPLRESAKLTPGGRYLTLFEGDRLAVYEMESGRCAGHCPLPSIPDRCLATAFSHDGSQLGAMLEFSNGTHLVCWDFARGEILLDYAYDTSAGLRSFNAYLQWVPDTQALLYCGTVLLDAQSGVDVWTFPEDRRHKRLMLGLDRMLAVVDQPRSGAALTVVDLPKKDLEKVFETVRSGGMAVDTILPELVKANWLSARPVAVPNGFVDWAAAIDPAGEADKRVDREVLVATDQETIKALMFAAPESGRVAVQKNARRPSGSGRSAQATNLIERYDLDSGRKSRDVPLPSVYEMLDVSPSGDHVLVGFRQPSGHYDRLDVISFSPLKHIAGWRPYETETTASAANRESPKHVKFARFLSDSRLLTINAAGKLAVWDLPDCRAVYFFEDFGQPAAISPGRQYVVGVHHEQIRIFETATGECRGDLPTPATGVTLLRTAFRPDGQELAAVVSGGLDKALARWDMRTGKLEHEFPLPSDVVRASYFRQSGGLAWRGWRYLLLDNQYLIDVDNRAVVWRYHVPANMMVAGEGPDERNWCCTTRDQSYNGPKFVVGRPMPGASAQLKIDFVTLEKQLVLGPGMSVRLDVHLAVPGVANSRETLHKTYAETLQNRGIKIEAGAPLTLLISSRSGSTGSEIGVSRSHSRFPTPFPRHPGQVEQTFAQQRMTCVMTLKDSAGRERWSYERSVDMRASGWVESENAQGELARELQNSFANMVSSGNFLDDAMPTYVFGKLDEILGGQSQLTFGGEGPPPPPPKATVSR